jgi:hypothetical protein
MSGPKINIREWWPLAGALVALTIAITYAVSRSSQAAEGIQKASDLGASLSNAAAEVRDSTFAQEDVQRLTDQKHDLQQRLADARQPSLVQAELVKSAKEAGLTLREIQPIRSSVAGKKESDGLPQYRLTMQGTYSQMAEYLRQCTIQRLPARVVTLDLRPVRREGEEAARLTADITVEAFQSAAEAAKTQDTQ